MTNNVITTVIITSMGKKIKDEVWGEKRRSNNTRVRLKQLSFAKRTIQQSVLLVRVCTHIPHNRSLHCAVRFIALRKFWQNLYMTSFHFCSFYTCSHLVLTCLLGIRSHLALTSGSTLISSSHLWSDLTSQLWRNTLKQMDTERETSSWALIKRCELRSLKSIAQVHLQHVYLHLAH